MLECVTASVETVNHIYSLALEHERSGAASSATSQEAKDAGSASVKALKDATEALKDAKAAFNARRDAVKTEKEQRMKGAKRGASDYKYASLLAPCGLPAPRGAVALGVDGSESLGDHPRTWHNFHPGAGSDVRNLLLQVNIANFIEATQAATTRVCDIRDVFLARRTIPDFFRGKVPWVLSGYDQSLGVVLDINPPWILDDEAAPAGTRGLEMTAPQMAAYIGRTVVAPWKASGRCADIVSVRVRHPWCTIGELLTGASGGLGEYKLLRTVEGTPFRAQEAAERLDHPDFSVCVHGTYYYHILCLKGVTVPPELLAPQQVLWKPDPVWMGIYLAHMAVPSSGH